jgi:hypothetical protein
MERAVTLSLIFLAACCSAQHAARSPSCSPTGTEVCGSCAEADHLSPAGKGRLAVEAHGALLRAEVASGLLTGQPMKERDRRFFVSDTKEGEFDGVEAIVQSPGVDGERALARANDGLMIRGMSLTTRRYSGRNGILVDVRTTRRRWTAADDWLFEEQFDATYCVVSDPDGGLRIQRVEEEMWPSPVTRR